MTVRAELDAAWGYWAQADLYKKWRRSNPGEAAKLDAFRAGGARPVLVTATGRALVAETAAWLLSAPTEPPPPVAQPFWSWASVSDIPDLRDGNNGRLSDATFAGRSAISVTVSGSGDSSAGGDAAYGTTGNLNEPWITEGADSWHAMDVYLPSASWRHSVISSGWNTLLEFHEPAIAPRSTHFGVWGSDPPVLQMACAGGSTVAPTDVWVRDTVPVLADQWQRWLIHVRWSKAAAGYVEWWVNDRQIVGRSSPNVLVVNGGQPVADSYPTAWSHSGAFRAPYFQAGHYRGPSRPDVEVTYMARVVSGPTRESVA